MTKPRSQLGDLWILPVFLLILSALSCIATRDPFEESATLVPEPKIDITYHGGPLLSGKGSLPLYILWYGHFSPSQQTILKDFFASFSTRVKSPSVRTWWSVTSTYKDARGITVFPSIKIVKQIEDNYSMGKFLARNGTKELVLGAIDSGKFPRDTRAFYLVLTAEDVEVHGFCVQTCAYHRHTEEESAHPANLAFGWVGNSMWKCAGKCAWPFAHPRDYFGPDKEPLVSPNADVGVDGMIINIAMVLAGAATNPFGNGYYQGHELSHLGAASACAGIYGKHAYPGEPGQLRIEGNRKASFNTFGANGRKFLLPAIWDPITSSCAYPS